MLEKEITFDRFVRGIIFLLGVVIAIVAVNYLSGVLIPFVIAWVLAYMLYPLVSFFQYKCKLKSRVVSIIVTLSLLCGAIYGIGYIIIPPMLTEFGHLKDIALNYIEKGADNATIPYAVQHFIHTNARQFELERLLRQQDIVGTVKDSLPKIWSLVWSTANVIISIISSLIALLYLFFLLTDYEQVSTGWLRFIPVRRRAFIGGLATDVSQGMSRYFRGQALVALSNCIMFSIGFALIGFPIPVGLGVFIGLISFIPYVQVVGIIPATLLALLKAADTGANFWWLIGGVFLVYIVVQIIQDVVVTPKIMGKFMGLRPAVILLSLSIWGYLMGIIGLIVALPLTTLMISYYKRYIVKEDLEDNDLDDNDSDDNE